MVAIGHSSPSFCHDDPAQTLEKCAEAGFDVWEIVGDGRHFLPEAAPAIKAAMPSYAVRLQLHAPIADVNLGSLNPRAWELSVRTVEESLQAAPALGIGIVTVHPGNHSPLSRGHYDKVHEATRRALRRLAPLAGDLGLSLLLENMTPSWAFETDSLGLLDDLIQGTGMGITFDLAHAHVADRVDEFLASAGRVRNVHVSDNKGRTDDHLPLGEGNVKWKKALDDLLTRGYSNTIVIESDGHESGAKSLALIDKHIKKLA
jgi:sugar phosphate isomerase/epimerase